MRTEKYKIDVFKTLLYNLVSIFYMCLQFVILFLFLKYITNFKEELFQIIGFIGLIFFITQTMYPNIKHIEIYDNWKTSRIIKNKK